MRHALPLLLAGSALLSGCVVGPNYKGPPVAAPKAAEAKAFHRADAAPVTAGEPTAQWWTALNDPKLNGLIDQALAASPDVAIARARIVQARAGLASSKAAKMPTTGVAGVYLDGKIPTGSLGGSSGSSTNLQIYSLNFDATWELDLFGGQARAIEGAAAQAEATEAALDGAKVSLEAEVAQAYVTLRQLQQRLAMSQRNAEIEGRMLAVVRQRQQGGTASSLDVERLNNQLQSTEAQLVPINAQITDQLDRLAMLTGQEPGALDVDLLAPAPVPAPPAQVAVGDPAAMLRRRPDIRQAERKLAQSNAVVGQRTADLFPKVNLLGAIGYSSPKIGDLLNSDNQTFIGAPLLQWTPFDFGRTRASIAKANGAYDEAEASYRKTVLAALQDAETSLSRYGRQRDNITGLMKVQASADRSAQLQAIRQQGGTATTLDVLDTERARVQAELGVVDAKAQLTTDYIALQKSLGLGWQ